MWAHFIRYSWRRKDGVAQRVRGQTPHRHQLYCLRSEWRLSKTITAHHFSTSNQRASIGLTTRGASRDGKKTGIRTPRQSKRWLSRRKRWLPLLEIEKSCPRVAQSAASIEIMTTSKFLSKAVTLQIQRPKKSTQNLNLRNQWRKRMLNKQMKKWTKSRKKLWSRLTSMKYRKITALRNRLQEKRVAVVSTFYLPRNGQSERSYPLNRGKVNLKRPLAPKTNSIQVWSSTKKTKRRQTPWRTFPKSCFHAKRPTILNSNWLHNKICSSLASNRTTTAHLNRAPMVPMK